MKELKMSNLAKTVAGRGPGRPTREHKILQDKKKCKKKKKMQNTVEGDLTIMVQGDARKHEEKKDFEY